MIFINYAREDHEPALKLYKALKTHGHQPWIDTISLSPGQEWEPAIQQAINNCDYFIALLSYNSIGKRGYVQAELRTGISILETMPPNRPFLIPVRLNACEPSHLLLKRLQWVDLFPSWRRGLDRLHRLFAFAPASRIAQRQEETDPRQKLPTRKTRSSINELWGQGLSVARNRDTTGTRTSVAGTYWIAYESDGETWEFAIKAGGLVITKQRTGIVQCNGKWRIAGKKLYMEFNNRFAQYRAHVRNGELVDGEAQNLDGRDWTWHGVRQSSGNATWDTYAR